MERITKFRRKRAKRGFALPMVLVVLLLGAALTAASFYLADNLRITSNYNMADTMKYSAGNAQQDLALGTIWRNLVNDKNFGRWVNPGVGSLTKPLIDQFRSDNSTLFSQGKLFPEDILAVWSGDFDFRKLPDGQQMPVKGRWVVYDTNYEPGFNPKDIPNANFPAALREFIDPTTGHSIKQETSYLEKSGLQFVGFYLVRVQIEETNRQDAVKRLYEVQLIQPVQ